MKYYLSFVLDQCTSLDVSPRLVSHLQNWINYIDRIKKFKKAVFFYYVILYVNFIRENCMQQFYLHDKFFVFCVDEIEDVQVDSGAKVICRL